jgi:hypothetical protein
MNYRNALVIGAGFTLAAAVIAVNPFTAASASGPQGIHTGTNNIGNGSVDITSTSKGHAFAARNRGKGVAVMGQAVHGAGVVGSSVNGAGGLFSGKTGLWVNGPAFFTGNINALGEVNADSFEYNGTELTFQQFISPEYLAAGGGTGTPVPLGNGASVLGYPLASGVKFTIPQAYKSETISLNVVVPRPTANPTCVLSTDAGFSNAPLGGALGAPQTMPMSPQSFAFGPTQTNPDLGTISGTIVAPPGGFTSFQFFPNSASTCTALVTSGSVAPNWATH